MVEIKNRRRVVQVGRPEVGERNWFKLERDGKVLRIGYLNGDRSLGSSVMVQQTTIAQDELILYWLMKNVGLKDILEAVSEHHGIDAVDEALDSLYPEDK